MVTCVRPLSSIDLQAVVAIEFEANPVPWRREDFLTFIPSVTSIPKALEKPQGVDPGGQPQAWVYADPEVRGFLCVIGAADEVELQSLAVEKARWGRGVGSFLMEAMLNWVRMGMYRVLHLEVRENNLRALKFYQRWGFIAVGRRPHYYSDNGEAAILMSLEMPAKA